MQARLIDQDVRHFRAVIGHILHPPHPFDVLWFLRVWHPKCCLIDPVSFALDLVGKTKRLKHLHRAGVDAIGFALDDVAGHALDDHRLNLRKLRQLRRQTQTRWACPSNQHIYFFWQRLVDASVAAIGRCFLNVRVAATESVFIKLHACLQKFKHTKTSAQPK